MSNPQKEQGRESASRNLWEGIPWIEESWGELKAQETRERMELLALPPAEAQIRADVLFGKLWEPLWSEMDLHIPGMDRLPGV